MSSEMVDEDPILSAVLQDAIVDPDTLGIILGGSRAAGCAQPDSDYDLFWVLSDRAHARRQESTEPLHLKRPTRNGPVLDIVFTCPQELAASAEELGWWNSTYATTAVILDKTGEVLPAVQALEILPHERAHAEAVMACDAYLNAFHRSLRSWRRGDELGARLHAADSVLQLIRLLFLLERRWPPHHDHLQARLPILELQGWPPGVLPDALLSLLRNANPHLQQELEARVEGLLRARGFGDVLDGWGEALHRAKSVHFA